MCVYEFSKFSRKLIKAFSRVILINVSTILRYRNSSIIGSSSIDSNIEHWLLLHSRLSFIYLCLAGALLMRDFASPQPTFSTWWVGERENKLPRHWSLLPGCRGTHTWCCARFPGRTSEQVHALLDELSSGPSGLSLVAFWQWYSCLESQTLLKARMKRPVKTSFNRKRWNFRLIWKMSCGLVKAAVAISV